jgi:hypothetical protein
MVTTKLLASMIPYAVRGEPFTEFVHDHPDGADLGTEWDDLLRDIESNPQMVWMPPTEMPDVTEE